MAMPTAGSNESDALSEQVKNSATEQVLPNQVEAEEAVVVDGEESQE